jgi:hypothetical protein
MDNLCKKLLQTLTFRKNVYSCFSRNNEIGLIIVIHCVLCELKNLLRTWWYESNMFEEKHN